MKNVKLAIIDNSLDHTVYDPIRHWKSCLNMDFVAFTATKSFFPEVKDFTHLILTGSEASILDRGKWVYEEVELIREAVEKNVSILGSCYGHQLLAVALAGPHCVRRCVYPEIGWIHVDIQANAELFAGRTEAYSFSSHFDEVTDLPEDFLVLASSTFCSIQAFRVKDKPVWGLQLHPEISTLEATIYLRNRIKKKHAPVDLFVKALESVPRDSGLIYPVVQRFTYTIEE